jgi:hypothetical protein
LTSESGISQQNIVGGSLAVRCDAITISCEATEVVVTTNWIKDVLVIALVVVKVVVASTIRCAQKELLAVGWIRENSSRQANVFRNISGA